MGPLHSVRTLWTGKSLPNKGCVVPAPLSAGSGAGCEMLAGEWGVFRHVVAMQGQGLQSALGSVPSSLLSSLPHRCKLRRASRPAQPPDPTLVWGQPSRETSPSRPSTGAPWSQYAGPCCPATKEPQLGRNWPPLLCGGPGGRCRRRHHHSAGAAPSAAPGWAAAPACSLRLSLAGPVWISMLAVQGGE